MRLPRAFCRARSGTGSRSNRSGWLRTNPSAYCVPQFQPAPAGADLDALAAKGLGVALGGEQGFGLDPLFGPLADVDVEVDLVGFEEDPQVVGQGHRVGRNRAGGVGQGGQVHGLVGGEAGFVVLVARGRHHAAASPQVAPVGDHDVGAHLQDDLLEGLHRFERPLHAVGLRKAVHPHVADSEEGADGPELPQFSPGVVLPGLVDDPGVPFPGGLDQLVVEAFVVLGGPVGEGDHGNGIAERSVDAAGAGAVGEVVGMGHHHHQAQRFPGKVRFLRLWSHGCSSDRWRRRGRPRLGWARENGNQDPITAPSGWGRGACRTSCSASPLWPTASGSPRRRRRAARR